MEDQSPKRPYRNLQLGKMNTIVYFFGCGLKKVCLKPKNKYLS